MVDDAELLIHSFIFRQMASEDRSKMKSDSVIPDVRVQVDGFDLLFIYFSIIPFWIRNYPFELVLRVCRNPCRQNLPVQPILSDYMIISTFSKSGSPTTAKTR